MTQIILSFSRNYLKIAGTVSLLLLVSGYLLADSSGLLIAMSLLFVFFICTAPLLAWANHISHMNKYREEKKRQLENMSAEERLQREASRKSEQIASKISFSSYEVVMCLVWLVILFVGGVIVWAVGKTVITWAFGVTFPS